jgi:hypothetical protein
VDCGGGHNLIRLRLSDQGKLAKVFLAVGIGRGTYTMRDLEIPNLSLVGVQRRHRFIEKTGFMQKFSRTHAMV